MEDLFFLKEGILKENIDLPNHFLLFNLPQKYLIDFTLLEQSFENILFQLHPDLFAVATESQKNLSLKYSTHIKKAKEELLHPFKRAIYLCKLLYKIPTDKELKQTQFFLLETLKIQERLEKIENTEAEKKLIAKLKKDQQQLLSELSKNFDLLKQSDNKEDLFKQISQKIGKIKYYCNIIDKINSMAE